MRIFLLALAACVVISIAASVVLDGYQRNADTASTTVSTRIR